MKQNNIKRINHLLCRLFTFVVVCTIVSCTPLDNPLGDNISGNPFKVRVEVSVANPNDYMIRTGGAIYLYYIGSIPETNAFSNLERDYWFVSPYVQEFEVPRDFNSITFTCKAWINFMSASDFENLNEENEFLTVTVTFDEHQIIKIINKYECSFSIKYHKDTKKYAIKQGNEETVYTSKLY